MENNDYFNQAADELDMITQEGFFGRKAKLLVEKREDTPTSEFLFECFMNIFSEPQYGTKNTIGIMFTLAKLYSEAISAKQQDAVDVLTAFMKGTDDHPELECLSSYSEFLSRHVESKQVLSEIQAKIAATTVDKKRLASSVLTAYSKGVELVGKVFTQLLTLEQMIHGQPHDLYQNSLLTIYKKIDNFLVLSNGDYDKLATVIDRSIRNADSHLNAYFSVNEQAYIMKKTVKTKGKTKTETFKLPWAKMVLEVYPKIGWFVQGYLGSCILLILSVDNQDLYKAATKRILELNSDPNVL